MGKIWIRDKHPGSATLIAEPTDIVRLCFAPAFVFDINFTFFIGEAAAKTFLKVLSSGN
jgi:hypothetical protein